MGCASSLPEVPLVTDLVPTTTPLVKNCIARGSRCCSIQVPAYLVCNSHGMSAPPPFPLTMRIAEESGRVVCEVHARHSVNSVHSGYGAEKEALEAALCPSALVARDGTLLGALCTAQDHLPMLSETRSMIAYTLEPLFEAQEAVSISLFGAEFAGDHLMYPRVKVTSAPFSKVSFDIFLNSPAGFEAMPTDRFIFIDPLGATGASASLFPFFVSRLGVGRVASADIVPKAKMGEGSACGTIGAFFEARVAQGMDSSLVGVATVIAQLLNDEVSFRSRAGGGVR